MDNIKQIDCLVRIADALRGSVETNNIVPVLYIISELRRSLMQTKKVWSICGNM